jgi:hypothetical protein
MHVQLTLSLPFTFAISFCYFLPSAGAFCLGQTDKHNRAPATDTRQMISTTKPCAAALHHEHTRVPLCCEPLCSGGIVGSGACVPSAIPHVRVPVAIRAFFGVVSLTSARPYRPYPPLRLVMELP